MPPDYQSAAYDLAIYEEVDGELGRYELEWFNETSGLPGDPFTVQAGRAQLGNA